MIKSAILAILIVFLLAFALPALAQEPAEGVSTEGDIIVQVPADDTSGTIEYSLVGVALFAILEFVKTAVRLAVPAFGREDPVTGKPDASYVATMRILAFVLGVIFTFAGQISVVPVEGTDISSNLWYLISGAVLAGIAMGTKDLTRFNFGTLLRAK